jgi:hypothetical protein
MDQEEEKAMRRGCKQKRVQIMDKEEEKAMRRECKQKRGQIIDKEEEKAMRRGCKQKRVRIMDKEEEKNKGHEEGVQAEKRANYRYGGREANEEGCRQAVKK